MIFSKILSQNFKHVRVTYNFSISELSRFLNLNTTSVIGGIETYKGLPSLDLLTRFAMKFGISTDWLLGFSDVIYTQQSLSTGEKNLEEQLINLDLPILSLRMLLMDDKWKNSTSRSENFSLGVRGNIIVLANWIIFQSQEQKENLKNKQRLVNFEQLLLRQIQVPIYDVEKN